MMTAAALTYEHGELINSRTVRQGMALKVHVSPFERLAIKTKPEAPGLYVSAGLRAAAPGVLISPSYDQRAILALLEVNADQGCSGKLINLRLSAHPGFRRFDVQARLPSRKRPNTASGRV